MDATRLHLFDPEDGRNLTSSQEGPAATGGDGDGQSPVGRDPEPAVEERGEGQAAQEEDRPAG